MANPTVSDYYDEILLTATNNSSGISLTEKTLDEMVKKVWEVSAALPIPTTVPLEINTREMTQVVEALLRGERELPKTAMLKCYLGMLEHLHLEDRIPDKEKLPTAEKTLQKFRRQVRYELDTDQNPERYSWKKKDGTKVPYKEMDDSYLLNVIGYIQTKAVDKVLLEGEAATTEEYYRRSGLIRLLLEVEKRELLDKVDPDLQNLLQDLKL